MRDGPETFRPARLCISSSGLNGVMMTGWPVANSSANLLVCASETSVLPTHCGPLGIRHHNIIGVHQLGGFITQLGQSWLEID